MLPLFFSENPNQGDYIMNTKTQNIATLNDYVRTKCMKPVFDRYEIPCKFLITRGVAALGPIAQIEISLILSGPKARRQSY